MIDTTWGKRAIDAVEQLVMKADRAEIETDVAMEIAIEIAEYMAGNPQWSVNGIAQILHQRKGQL